ncbi:AAA family ATPase [Candidatus Woesearchaeota archaeon]|nr:AAA family ATPase [Candidatus Woesearchaeota archaeon]
MFESFLSLEKGINLVYGESATGKTTLCLQCAGEEAKKGKVVFIDTEFGFSLERFKQIYPENYKEILDNIYLIRVADFEEQCKFFDSLDKMKNVSFVIIDTIGSHYRVLVAKDPNNINKKIDRQLQILKEMNRKGVKVLISNQVYSSLDTNKVEVVGGNMLKNWSSVIIRMDKNPRKIKVEKPKNIIKEFIISDNGILLA